MNKQDKWIGIINTILSSKDCSAKELEQLIGKLVRASLIMPRLIAFIKPLWTAFYATKNGLASINQDCIDILLLWIKIIYRCAADLLISKLLLRMPT